MNNEICFKINNDVLYLEQILVELDFPILYTCVDVNKCRYVVLCIDYDELKYMVIKVQNSTLLKMLKKEIPMRDLFFSNDEVFIIQSGDDYENDKICVKNSSDLTEDELPAKGAFFEITNQELNNFIEKLEKENCISIVVDKKLIRDIPLTNEIREYSYVANLAKPKETISYILYFQECHFSIE